MGSNQAFNLAGYFWSSSIVQKFFDFCGKNLRLAGVKLACHRGPPDFGHL
jgi:hypothetical protein